MFQDKKGKILKKIDFKLYGTPADTLFPSILNFKAIYPDKNSTPLIIAVASSPGGSDIHFETTIIGFISGKIVELTPDHIDSSSQDALCLEEKNFILFNFLWEEAHYDPHRYEAISYKMTNDKLEKIETKQTKKKYKDWKGAASELGYHCGDDLIQTTNPSYK